MNKVVWLLLLVVPSVFGHGIGMTSLSIKHQSTPNQMQYDVTHISVNLAGAAPARLVFPGHCKKISGDRLSQGAQKIKITYSMECESSLGGSWLEFDNQKNVMGQFVFHFESDSGEKYQQTLTKPRQIMIPEMGSGIESAPETSSDSLLYITSGVEHMLLGLDHVLFVLLITFLYGETRKIIAAVTGFALGHSLSLGLSAGGWLQLDMYVVEALIALSIVYLGAEVISKNYTKQVALRRFPFLVMALFGLFHGAGFASALGELEYTGWGLVMPLFYFNFGIELAQLFLVILFVRLGFVLSRFGKLKDKATYLVGCIAGYYFFERVFSLPLAHLT